MPLRLPRPPAEIIAAFEAALAASDVVTTAIAKGMDLGEDGAVDEPRVPEKFWTLGALPVEGFPKGTQLDGAMMGALKVRCWRFFVGLDDGGVLEVDFRNEVLASRYVPPGRCGWLSNLSKAMLLWAHTTAGNNEARLVELPWIEVRAVRAVGPDPGVILDEAWEGGDHGAPMDEETFVAYVLRRFAERRAEMADAAKG